MLVGDEVSRHFGLHTLGFHAVMTRNSAGCREDRSGTGRCGIPPEGGRGNAAEADLLDDAFAKNFRTNDVG